MPDPAEQQRAAESSGRPTGRGRRRRPRLRGWPAASTSTPLDVDVLLVALAPDIDAAFERLYGYLNDDVTRRRASAWGWR